jgi:hypothetical protein
LIVANGEERRSDHRAGDESVCRIQVREKKRRKGNQPDNHEGEERRQRGSQRAWPVELKAKFLR